MRAVKAIPARPTKLTVMSRIPPKNRPRLRQLPLSNRSAKGVLGQHGHREVGYRPLAVLSLPIKLSLPPAHAGVWVGQICCVVVGGAFDPVTVCARCFPESIIWHDGDGHACRRRPASCQGGRGGGWRSGQNVRSIDEDDGPGIADIKVILRDRFLLSPHHGSHPSENVGGCVVAVLTCTIRSAMAASSASSPSSRWGGSVVAGGSRVRSSSQPQSAGATVMGGWAGASVRFGAAVGTGTSVSQP